MSLQLPALRRARQRFASSPTLDIRARVRAELAQLRLSPGARIAVAAGSRGITNYAQIVTSVVRELERRGARPFVVPAMGSHGKATPEGQRAVLASLGLDASSLGVPIEASMAVRELGRTADGVPALLSEAALDSEGVLLVNRVKPHTSFGGELGSGLIKMLAVGLGKQAGASACHRALARLGHAHVFRTVARVLVEHAPILGGLAIVEDQGHQTSTLRFVPAPAFELEEPALLREARAKLARLPFEELDLLIVDRIGKDISGTGMDPNVIGRGVHGYSSSLAERPPAGPVIWRIFARELSPDSYGNAVGIGMADFTTDRLIAAIDRQATQANVLTSLSLQAAKLPLSFASDREAIEAALASLALDAPEQARVVRIRDTLELERLQLSPACSAAGLELEGEAEPMAFDAEGQLLPW